MTKTKSSKNPTQPLKERALRTALTLAATKKWSDVSMQDIAKSAKCTLAELHDLFEDRQDILSAYGRMIDKTVMERAVADAGASEHDRLFDVMMERFDVLNENRDGVRSILKSFCYEPKNAVISLPHLGRSMVWMMEAAGIDANGPRGAVSALGLLGVYLYVLRVWMNDDSQDMGKTMAALDRGLDRAKNLAGLLRL